MKTIWNNRLIFILSLFGIIIATYILQSYIRETPVVCLNSGCEIVRKSQYSRLLGFPVPAYGLLGYLLLAIIAFLRTVTDKPELDYGLLALSLFGAIVVTWFTYLELFVIRAICTWCAISAINMYGIFFLALKDSEFLKQNIFKTK